MSLGFYFFLKLCLAFGVFILARSLHKEWVKKIIFALIIAALLESSLGVWQFLAQKSFTSTLLGMSGYEAFRAGVAVLKNDAGRFLRAYGTFPHPNILGSFLSAALVLLCAISIRQSKKRFLILISSVIVLLGLIVSFSRSAWLGLAVGIGWFAWYWIYREGESAEKKFFWKILFVLGAAGIIFTFILKDVVFPRFDSAVIEKEHSVSERETTWREAILLIRERPFTGVGAGNYTAALIQKYPNTPVYVIQPAHNVFLLVGAELGLIGLILFLGLMYKIVAGIFSGNAKVYVSSAPFFAAFIALAPGLFVDHFLWSSHFGVLSFFLLAGLSMNRSGDT
jgi:O-antigen ligase